MSCLLERCRLRTAPAPADARRDRICRVAEPHGLKGGPHGDYRRANERTAGTSITTRTRRGVPAIELIVPIFDARRPTRRDGPLHAATDVPASEPRMRVLC